MHLRYKNFRAIQRAMIIRLAFLLLVSALLSPCVSLRKFPCRQLNRYLDFPCQCFFDMLNGTHIDCDRRVFSGDFPLFPYHFRIHAFSQKHVGYQSLPAQIFTASDIPLRRLDFGDNSLRRLTDRLLEGIEDTLEELSLQNNLLGAGLNPIFSTAEFQGLQKLRLLQLARNGIKGLEEGIFKGCLNLEELHLEGNQLVTIPTGALRGPRALRKLYLQDNKINSIHSNSLVDFPSLTTLNMSNNVIIGVEGSGFAGLESLRQLYLARNKIRRLNSFTFEGLTALEELDLSNNFLTEVPTVALQTLRTLKRLSLGSNLLQTVEASDLADLKQLELLDLKRNNIAHIAPEIFLGMSRLRDLDLSINAIRNLDEDAFNGLMRLERLAMNDNNILFIPTTALSRLKNLQRLELDHNRVAVLTSANLESLSNILQLSMAHNVIREIPDDTFKNFTSLANLNLYGNQITTLTGKIFSQQNVVQSLNFGYNKLSQIPAFDLPSLTELDLSRNELTNVNFDMLSSYPNLGSLKLANNKISEIAVNSLVALRKLQDLDLSNNAIRQLAPRTLQPPLLRRLDFSNNYIRDIDSQTFHNLAHVETIDLRENRIETLKPEAFLDLPSLTTLLLGNNRLNSIRNDLFGSSNSTSLRRLDLSNNFVTYVYPSSFDQHQHLESIDLSNNRFSFYPTEVIRSLSNMAMLNMSHNQLKSLEEADFASMPKLLYLDLSHNQVEFIGASAFQNSSQLQFLNLGHNKLEKLPMHTFRGIAHLNLNLEHNNLSYLPPNIFDRSDLNRLQSIDLSYNLFQEIPTEALQKQYFFLETVNLRGNKVKDVPSNTNTLVNIKYLDLSFNPLSEDSIINILNEPKTVLELNLAGTGMKKIPILETPFLRSLNLSHNFINDLSEVLFEKPTLLEKLDLSFNSIPNLSFGLANIWQKLKYLREIDLSNNPVTYIIRGDFQHLASLEVLKVSHLKECTKIEKNAFNNLPNLRELSLYDFPRLGYLDTKGILEYFFTLEKLNIEIKDQAVGDQLHPAFLPRLHELGIRGHRIRGLSTGSLAGLNSPNIHIELSNTSLASLPASLFLPVPDSSLIILDISGSKFTNLSPQFVNILKSHQRSIQLQGLSSNPIVCDCNIITLQDWLLEAGDHDMLDTIKCTSPTKLADKSLGEIAAPDLICDPNSSTSVPSTLLPLVFATTERVTTSEEPDIIWSTPPRDDSSAENKKPTHVPQSGLNNMDTIIIAIVGGVVGFITLLVIIICIVRLRAANSQYSGGPLAGPLALRAQGKCTCLKPPPPMYGGSYLAPYPPYATYSSTLSLKHQGPNSGPSSFNSYCTAPPSYGTASSRRGAYYSSPPYYVSYPTENDPDHR